MPLYEYQCETCEHRFELIQKFSDPPAETCPSCGGGPVAKLLSSPAIQFKGSGWYITDYARKPNAAGKDGKDAKDGKEAAASAAKNGQGGEAKSGTSAGASASGASSSTSTTSE